MATASLTVIIELPPLEQPCPHCATPEAQERIRLENEPLIAAWDAWNADETEAFQRYMTGSRVRSVESWVRSSAYQALLARKPQGEPKRLGAGCVECAGSSVQLTPAGRQLLAFVRRHLGSRL